LIYRCTETTYCLFLWESCMGQTGSFGRSRLCLECLGGCWKLSPSRV